MHKHFLVLIVLAVVAGASTASVQTNAGGNKPVSTTPKLVSAKPKKGVASIPLAKYLAANHIAPGTFFMSTMHYIPHDPNAPFYQHERELERVIVKANDLRRVGDFAGSKQLFQQVYDEGTHYTTYFDAVEGLGEVARLAGETGDALRFYRELVEFTPGQMHVTSRSNDIDVRVKYALLLRSVRKYDEAWANYQAGMAPRTGWNLPKPPPVSREDVPTDRFVFSACLAAAEDLKGRDPVQAAALTRQAIAANPTHGLGWFYLGEITSENDPVTAKAAYTKAVLYGHGDYLDRAGYGLAVTTAQVEEAQATAKP